MVERGREIISDKNRISSRLISSLGGPVSLDVSCDCTGDGGWVILFLFLVSFFLSGGGIGETTDN